MFGINRLGAVHHGRPYGLSFVRFSGDNSAKASSPLPVSPLVFSPDHYVAQNPTISRTHKIQLMAPMLTRLGINTDKAKPNRSELKKLLEALPAIEKLEGKSARNAHSITRQVEKELRERFPGHSWQTPLMSLLSHAPTRGEGLYKAHAVIPQDSLKLLKQWGHPKKGHLTNLTSLELKSLVSVIPLLRALDQEELFSETSMTNQLYRLLYPRQYGVVVYGGSLKGSNADALMQQTRAFTKVLGEAGFFGVTGGGPNFMEAAAKGFLDAGSHTVGSNIMRFNDSDPLIHHEVTMYHGVPARIGAPGGYEGRGASVICFPGGVGTNREFWGKLEDLIFGVTPYPTKRVIILVDISPRFTEEIKGTLNRMIEDGRVKPKVLDYIRWVKTPEEAIQILNDPNIPLTSGRPLDDTLS